MAVVHIYLCWPDAAYINGSAWLLILTFVGVKCDTPYRSVGDYSSPFLRPKLVDGYTTESVTHGRCDDGIRLPSHPQTTATAAWTVVISHPAEGKRLLAVAISVISGD